MGSLGLLLSPVLLIIGLMHVVAKFSSETTSNRLEVCSG